MKQLQLLLLTAILVGTTWIALQLLDMFKQRRRRTHMPEVWPIKRRQVLNARERHVYAVMKQAFPQHELMVKLPLTRFTQLSEPGDAAFWHELLTPLTVTFTLCDANTQPFAVVDLLNDGRAASSASRLKKRALDAAQVRYVQLMPDTAPSARFLRDMVLSEKEQRHSSWKMCSDVSPPIALSALQPTLMLPQPETRQPIESVLHDQKAQLLKQVQVQRQNRQLRQESSQFSDSASYVDIVLGENPAPTNAKQPVTLKQKKNVREPKQDLRDFYASKKQTELSSFNLDTIRGRDSFLTPDSRSPDLHPHSEGDVTTYTTKYHTNADHIWLDSKRSS